MTEIAQYIKHNSPYYAARFLSDLKQACQKIKDAPYSYQAADMATDLGLRRRVFGRYIIFYRVDVDIEIVRVLHGSRDQAAVFGVDDD